jgi:hypothetical protein
LATFTFLSVEFRSGVLGVRGAAFACSVNLWPVACLTSPFAKFELRRFIFKGDCISIRGIGVTSGASAAMPAPFSALASICSEPGEGLGGWTCNVLCT